MLMKATKNILIILCAKAIATTSSTFPVPDSAPRIENKTTFSEIHTQTYSVYAHLHVHMYTCTCMNIHTHTVTHTQVHTHKYIHENT